MSTEQKAPGVVSLEAVKGAPDHVLVKFNFTNPKHIPPGIPEKKRGDDQNVDKGHAVWAIVNKMAKLAAVGRLRVGRVDTGEHVIDNIENVQVATLRRGFANNGFLLADAHWYRHVPTTNAGQRPPQPKFVVCLTYRAVDPQDTVPELPRITIEALRQLAGTTWKFCHVWNNPDGCCTINMVGRGWNDRDKCYDTPENAIVVRNHTLQAIKVVTPVSESGETEETD